MTETGIPIADLIQSSPTLGSAVTALGPAADLLDRLFYNDVSTSFDEETLSIWASLILDGQIGFELPGGFAIKIGEGDGVTPLIVGMRISPAGVAIAVEEIAVVLSIPDSLLRPAPPADGGETPEGVELVLEGALILDESLNLRVEGFESVSLPRSFVGSSSVVISADDVSIDTRNGLMLGAARIELPEGMPELAPEELVLTHAVIGPSGVSGRLEAQYTPEFDAEAKRFVGQGSGELGGVPFAFSAIAIELHDNDLVDASLAGQLLLPFFDQPTGVAITLGGDGSFSIDIGAGTTLASLEREGLLRLTVEHIKFEMSGGKLLIHIGGTVTLLIGDEEWPTFRADDISIDAGGNISLHGAGLELKNGKPLDLGSSPAGTGPVPGVTIDKLALSGNPLDGGLIVDAELSTVTNAGPFTGTLQQIGVHARLAARLSGAAKVDDLSFRPPTRIAIAVDSERVSGGGLISRDAAKDSQKIEYSGIVELLIGEKVAVKAIGLLTTRMPDGSKGYSLLIIITAEGFQPIPLPLGFRLTGIGGLLALHRTFAEEALRSGLKNHALDSVMFPKDPIRNAQQIQSNLNRLFPTARDHYLFGPMVQIQWGTPTLVTAQVAVVLEFGSRLRLLVLAQIAAILPKPDNDLIRLQMDAVGVIDFDQGTASLDATLYDSRLLKKFVITGDMALRLKWSAPPNFALAVGGLHPAFNPPPNFPKLERVAISLAAGDNPRIRCEAYFALTGSSIQFGARAELYASAAGFSIQGEIGFDVLIQRDPFAFLAEFMAKVQLKRGSTNLFMVKVEGALAGPRPLHVKAKATFEIFWWDVSIRVDRTLVAGEKPPLPKPVHVLPLLLEALAQPTSWTAQMPAGQRPVVVLGGRPGAAGGVLLHPLGQLTVSQSIVPLDMDISRFGDAAPAGERRFSISTVSPGWQTLQAVREFFAPAQFFEMSDAEKLSRPSFESMPAGVSLGSEGFSISAGDGLEFPAIQFETIIVGQPQDGVGPTPPKDEYQLSPLLLSKQASFGAAASSALRHTGAGKYRTTAGKHQIAKKGWSIVSTDDLKVQTVPGIEGPPASYSEADQALHKLKQQDPAKARSLKILRLFEVQGSE